MLKKLQPNGEIFLKVPFQNTPLRMLKVSMISRFQFQRLSRYADSGLMYFQVSTDIYLDVVPEFQRVALRKDGKNPMPWADVTGRQAVSRMVSLLAADALLVLPAKSDEVQCIKRNQVVDAMLLI